MDNGKNKEIFQREASIDFKQYYDIEKYLFHTVHSKYITDGNINATDFFLIVVWKANRSKTKVASRLLKIGYATLDEAVKSITSKIFVLEKSKEKLGFLMKDCGFRLPMATAILTVLYPDILTVYDIRVCNVLQESGFQFHSLTNRNFSDQLWNDYLDYINAVGNAAPAEFTLRDKDRYLWGKSFHEQLVKDISTEFNISKRGK